ncbi:MAG: EF-P lysine aminoacylase EpmA [Beijerinckiaceae bacterium]|nr:EF-P lysine aminoacylase EpmA [Beijerinckiaceae bacterium]
MSWWQPGEFARRLPVLRQRNRAKAAVRAFFDAAGFLEVETPILQVSPGNETHISAFSTALTAPDGRTSVIYLHSSPEFACKKLLAAGAGNIFTFAPVFRNGERGRLHHPEFTMLEWYRARAPLDALENDCADILRLAAKAVDCVVLRHGQAEADPGAAPEVLSVVEAFDRYAGIALETMLPEAAGGFTRLAEATAALGLRVAGDDTWSDLFSKILSARDEPRLGLGPATILSRYRASEAALARLCPDDNRFAERFELYACGVELANAFGELRDVAEQRRRFEAAEAERQRIYGLRYPLDEDFLDALALMPECAGIALGFDRLVMLMSGARRIEDVLFAPVAERGA